MYIDIADFNTPNATNDSLKTKKEITRKTGNNRTKSIEILDH